MTSSGRNRLLAGIVAFAALTVLAVLVAYPRIYSGFASYDDEGYMLIALRSFVEGGALYDDVFTQYGPFYYEAWGGVFSLFGLGIDLDSGRMATLVAWILTCLGTFAYAGLLDGRRATTHWVDTEQLSELFPGPRRAGSASPSTRAREQFQPGQLRATRPLPVAGDAPRLRLSDPQPWGGSTSRAPTGSPGRKTGVRLVWLLPRQPAAQAEARLASLRPHNPRPRSAVVNLCSS